MKTILVRSGYSALIVMALLVATSFAHAAMPVISGISVSPSSTSAIINWNTDTAASTQVWYGTSLPYSTNTALNSNLSTTHSVTLTGLNPNTVYHYSLLSADASGTTSTTTDQTFTTTGSTTVTPTGAVLTLGATSGLAGGTFSVRGTGFMPYEQVTVTFGGNFSGTFMADSTGTFMTNVVAPTNSPLGSFTVRGSGASSSRSATALFTVGNSTTPPTTPPGNWTANEVALQGQVTALMNRISALEAKVATFQVWLTANGTAQTGGQGTGGGVPAGTTKYIGVLSDASQLSNGSFTLTSNGVTYTVNLATGATVWNNARQVVPVTNFRAGDSIRLDGSITSGTTITAEVVRDTSI
jgi:hypothetical protein